MRNTRDGDGAENSSSLGEDPPDLVPLPRLSPEETRRRLLKVCEQLRIDPDSAEAAELAELLANGADIGIVDSTD